MEDNKEVSWIRFITCSKIVLQTRRESHENTVVGRTTHLFENFCRQSLGNLVDIASGASGFNALLDGIGHGGDVAVHGVVDDGNLGHGGGGVLFLYYALAVINKEL